MMGHYAMVAMVAVLAVLASRVADAAPGRRVAIGMFDSMRFSPSQLTVTRGETIRFSVRNAGKIKHEMIIGTREELAHHRHAMQHDPGAHDASNMVHLGPGKQKHLTWQASQPGPLMFACLLPGHYEAGMHGTITVLPPP